MDININYTLDCIDELVYNIMLVNIKNTNKYTEVINSLIVIFDNVIDYDYDYEYDK